jgi:hypothetical protein
LRGLEPEDAVEPTEDDVDPTSIKKPGLVNIQKAIKKWPFVVDLPMKNGDFPWLYGEFMRKFMQILLL